MTSPKEEQDHTEMLAARNLARGGASRVHEFGRGDESRLRGNARDRRDSDQGVEDPCAEVKAELLLIIQERDVPRAGG